MRNFSEPWKVHNTTEVKPPTERGAEGKEGSDLETAIRTTREHFDWEDPQFKGDKES